MIDGLGEMVASGATGGVLGIFGAGMQRVLGMVGARGDHKRAMETRRQEHAQAMDEMRLEAETADKRTALELEGRRAEFDARAQVASFHHDTARLTEGQDLSGRQLWLLVVADFIRSLMRPTLTLGALGATMWVWSELPRGATEGVEIIHSFVFLQTASTTWWFASRPPTAKKEGS